MLDDILDGASSESLTHGLEPSLHSRVGGASPSASYLSAAKAADHARICRSTTLGFLLPQPKATFGKRLALNRHELSTDTSVDMDLLHKLEEQNSLLPPQDSTSFLLARLERQNELLDTDPKAVCIESNALKGNLSTLHRLIADSTQKLNSPNSGVVDPMSAQNRVLEPEVGDEEIDWEFWGMLCQDYNAVASKLPHLLAARVRQGLPSKLRGLIWQSMSQASSTYLETMYTQLLKEHSPYERIIQRDLARTFPQIDMFKEEGGAGQGMLFNILKAYSLYDPHVGYCQGLGFLVGPLLMNMDEKEAFCVFVRLMETYDMRTMFTLNMEGLQLRLYQFSALLSEHLPMLHAHLSFHSIHAAMYASQWFLSLFAYTYPLPLVLRIYDVVFCEGAPETIMRVAVAFLKKNEEKLMQLQEFEDLLDVLSSKLYEVYEGNAGEVIRDSMALSNEISKDKLDSLAMAYLAELEDQQKRAGEVVSKKLFRDRFGMGRKSDKPTAAAATASPAPASSSSTTSTSKPKMGRAGSRLSIAASFGSSVVTAQDEEEDESDGSDELDLARSKHHHHHHQSNSQILLEQVHDLAKALSTLQKEHVDVTESLVTAKMEKLQYVEEVEQLRKKVHDLERQQNRASMMSVISPSVISNSDTASSAAMSSPRTVLEESSKKEQGRRPSSSWSSHSHDDDQMEDRIGSMSLADTATKASSISSLNLSHDDLVHRLAQTERELAHITAELVHAKVSVMEAMNEAESQRSKAQELEKVLMDSREAVVLLQEQQVVLQNTKMTMAMDMDTIRHERDQMEKETELMRKQLEDTKRLWLEGQVERHNLNDRVKELEAAAAAHALMGGGSASSLSRGRSVRKSLGEAALMQMMQQQQQQQQQAVRSGSPSPRTSMATTMASLTEEGVAMLGDESYYRRGSGEMSEAGSQRAAPRRGSSDTLNSSTSGGGRESISSTRPAALVRKGWPSEKAASAGVVPSTPTSSAFGTRKFTVAESDTKLKRSQSTRSSVFGGLSFRRSASETS
ncbi:hypothetical protein DFQ27_006611 [Actinomortierella ambigua]|uniref:Rab-GAP TBC domain-containing protein n=1 Tax=Actinomortierella ambigua TaxID=1343610 RepID=A0A9P6PVA4_9FUNG|nr:hypothetical protein DFQ27_006611 [Actinomortierella ambigua]